MTSVTDGVRLGPLSDIPAGQGRCYAVGQDGRTDQVAVFRLRSGALRAVSAICPHSGGPLADGQIDEEVVICPLHQHTFDLATGCSRTGQPDLTSYHVEVDAEGQVVLRRPGS